MVAVWIGTKTAFTVTHWVQPTDSKQLEYCEEE